MANPRLLKKRVSSIKNIRKITKALEMVAASKVQKAQDAAVRADPYAKKVYELISSLDKETFESIPLLRVPQTVTNDLYIFISTNRGLAGSLNTNLFRKTAEFLNQQKGIHHLFATVGKKGRSFSAVNGELIADFSDSVPFTSSAPAIINLIEKTFTEGQVDAVYLVFNDFITALTQEPTIKKLLPIIKEDLYKEITKQSFDIKGESGKSENITTKSKYSYEPSAKKVLSELLPFYIEIQIVAAILEAEASEHSARMIAMKNASDNATELTDALTLEYNKERQSAITTEISDITTASSAIANE